ncbi:PREDICTED: tudor domain-containing protein 15-like [Mesitornis unicolor]|uniref:tudor domain-containing protein 15-like n=1 Tax=Mesitornis unicolor TaxID=54374 RepID=UPI000528C607|nr:PREDICTED: tudor domain-containing protein 15-like [Mesitornis unicolor]
MESLTPSPNTVDVNLKITHVECHTENLIIVFQGQYKSGCELDYYILQNEIQRVFKGKDNVRVGGCCLVEDTQGKWHRGRVLEKRGDVCEAFLIDTGQVLVVEETHLASACDELFQLPPKVVLGVFASILPLGEKWGSKAMNYFSSLVGLQIRGHVKAVIPYQLLILEVPKIIHDVLDLQLGKFVDGDSFCLIVETLRAFPQEMLCKRVPQLLQQKHPVKELLTFSNSERPTDFGPVPDDLFPRLAVGSKENVKITVAVNPNKFYCQMQRLQKELKDLTGAMHLYYEASSTENSKSFDSVGVLCAAKRQNGQWHRGVIKKLLSNSVEVWFMDFGNTEAVPSSCVQKLAVEFMTLPMVSFPCALSCCGSQDETVIKIQLKEFIQALIRQTSVCVHVDLINDAKRLYYVTLQDQNLGIDAKHPENLNEAAASCISPSEMNITSIAMNYKPCDERYSSFKNCTGNIRTKNCLPEWDISLSRHYKRAEMKINSFHTVFVVYVINPSDFWIQMCEYWNEFQALMKNIAGVYNRCGADEMVLKNPEPGLLCCARCSKDMHYYRGVVIEVLHKNITVHFLDSGNTDTVPCYDVKTLLPEFSDIPALAVCCELACTYPVDDVWVKRETDFFKGIVFNRPLLLFVIGKQNNKYIVNMKYKNSLEQGNVATLMVQAGFAEYWEKTPDSALKLFNWSEEVISHFKDTISASRGPLTCIIYALVLVNSNSICNIVDLQSPFIDAEEFLRKHGLTQPEHTGLRSLASLGSLHSFCYSSFNIKIGSEEEVYITHIHSPSKFYCQLNRNTATIEALMKKTSVISKMPNNVKYDTSSNTRLCIARYFEDGLFYRALAFPVESTSYVCVDFVDFGNKNIVERDQLMHIPDSATDLIFTPMQAIKCCLSDLRETRIPARVTRWFEETFLGKLLKAVIVSRESDGQIVVELYDGQLKVSEKIKEKISEELALKNYTEQLVGSNGGVIHHTEDEEEINKVTVKNPERVKLKAKVKCQAYEKYYQTDIGQSSGDREQTACNTDKLCSGSSEPLTSQDIGEPVSENSVAAQHREEPLFGDPASRSLCHPALNSMELKNLPQRDIQVNCEVGGYISHMNSPSSFYVQLAEDENIIMQLAEELKESMVSTGHENFSHELMVGDLVVAEDDAVSFYCRAVIKTLKSGNSFEVEFIDYGNTAVVSPSKICRIQEKFLTLPRLSVHCFLSRVKHVPDESWTNNSTSDFISKISNKPVACKFLQRHGEQWEIDIICDGRSMSNSLQKKDRTRWQNTAIHNRENRQNQILVKNGNAQDRKSRNSSGGQSETKAVRMKKTSTAALNVLPQDLKSGQIEGAEVINISENGEFHVQLLRNLQILRKLNVTLVKEAQRSDLLSVGDIKGGLECITKSERNLKWYRSKVMKKFIREKLMLVFFMDYGTCEIVSLNNAKMLSDEFKSIPEQAVCCKWVWFEKMRTIQFVHVVNALLDHEIKILFMKYLESSHIWEVDIFIGEILLLEYLNELLGHCWTIVGPEKSSNMNCKEFETLVNRKSVPWMLLQRGRRYPGFATAVTDPYNFCIQFEVLFDCMKNLSLLLSDLPDNLPALPERLVAPGATCLIKLGLEAQWNRAEISEVTSQSVVLTFIDYGFLKSIPYSSIHKLKVIPESVSYIPRLAQSCSLHNTAPAKGEYWSGEAKLLFRKLLSKPGLIVYFKHYGSKMKLEVDVTYEENNLAHALIAAGHAVWSERKCCLIPVGRIKSGKTD